MKRVLYSLLLAASLVLPAAYGNAASSDDASKYVETLGNQTITIISNAKLAKPQKQTRLEKVFSDNVDIPWVGRFVMGRFWKQATPDQQKRYLKEYQKFVITHYASRFAEYSSGQFKITGAREDAENEFIINMHMLSGDKNAEPVLVDYRVRGSKGNFKIFDVIVEGVSMITTQRSEFNAILSDKGIDTLIEKLANKSIAAETAKK